MSNKPQPSRLKRLNVNHKVKIHVRESTVTWSLELRWWDGKFNRKGLKTQNLEVALRVRNEFEQKYTEDYVTENMTLKKFLDRYIEAKREMGRSPKTIASILDRFHTLISTIGNISLTEVTKDKLQGYFGLQVEKRRKPAGIAVDFRTFRAAFNWAIDEEILKSNPLRKVKIPTVPRKFPRRLDLEQFAKLIEVIENYPDSDSIEWRRTYRRFEHATLTYLLLISGLRINECLKLRKSDIDFQKHTLFVSGKGGHEKELFISQSMTDRLKSLFKYQKSESEFVFPSATGGIKSSSPLGKWFRKYFNSAGIPTGDGLFHRIRHTTASLLSDSGFTSQDIAGLLGHSSPTITDKYITQGRDRQRELVESINSMLSKSCPMNSQVIRNK